LIFSLIKASERKVIPIIEVELKFRINSSSGLRAALVALGAKSERLTVQSDVYFDDPLRGFSELDFALRIRESGESYWLTFKGPNLDETSKMRKELEVPLADRPSVETLKQIFTALGFREIAKVNKTREQMKLSWSGTPISICLDQVEEVGEFVELEIVAADSAEAEVAKGLLHSLAGELKLEGAIRTSYLQLLLAERS
jgi:adenylate cyclase class 2